MSILNTLNTNNINFSNFNPSRFNFKFNKKILTLIFLLISLLFGGLAIFLAITINNRSVNPDDTAAAEEDCNPRCGPGEYCDSTTCPGIAFCCRVGTDCSNQRQTRCPPPPDIECVIEQQGVQCGSEARCSRPEEGRSIRFEICRNKNTGQVVSTRDLSDRTCTVKNPDCTSRITVINNCNREDIPACGTGKANENDVCVCQSNDPRDPFIGGQICIKQGNTLSWSSCSRDNTPNQPVQNCDKGNGEKAILGETRTCQSQGSDRFTGIQICTPSGWSECARVDGTVPGQNGCQLGTKLVNGVCVTDCDGTKHICACGQNLCSGNFGQKFRCDNNNQCKLVDSKEWLISNANCRVATNSGGQVGICSPAEFRNCNPEVNKMCWCENLGPVQNQGGIFYRYGQTGFRNVGECDSTCADKTIGGIYVASACGNPYRCPPPPTGVTPPPNRPPGTTCRPISYCNPIDSKRYTFNCLPDGSHDNPIIEDDPTCRSDCPRTSFCRGCDKITIDCNGNELSRSTNDPSCNCNDRVQYGYCSSMSINIAGQSLTVNTNTQSNANVIRIPKDQIPWGRQVNLNSQVAGDNSYQVGIYWMRPYVEDPNDPINQFGNMTHNCSFYILTQPKPGNNVTVTLPSDPTRVIRTDSYGQNNNCQNNSVNYNDSKIKGIIFGVNYHYQGNWQGLWCRNVGPNPNNAALFNQGTPQNQTCTNPCVIRTEFTQTTTITPTPPTTPTPSTQNPVCQSIQITNTRNNNQCNSTNPQNCNVRPGDTLNVVITGSNAENYNLTGSVTRWRTGINTQNQPTTQITRLPNTNNSFSVVIPNTVDMLSYSLQGSAIARNITSSTEACRATFNFTDNPNITKQINRNGSNPQIPQNQNPVIVSAGNIVEYDVTVNNNGNSILGNVLIYDRLININNGNPDNNTPIGVIISATNLSRTTGNSSIPNPVTLEGGFASNAVPPTTSLISHTNNTFNANNNVIQVRWNRIQAFYPGEVYSGKVRVQINNFTNYPGLRNEICLVVDTNQNNRPDPGEINICRQVDIFTQQPNFIISKTVNNTSPSLNDTITYTITLRNTSNNNLDLNRLTITDVINSEYVNRLNITPNNNGIVQGNTITWNSQSIIQANGGNSTLAPNSELNLTVQVRFNNNFFPDTTICVLTIPNEARASSTSPDFNASSNIVTINVNNPACVVTPTQIPTTVRPPITELPPTGIDARTSLFLITIIISVGAVTLYIVVDRNNFVENIFKMLIQQIKYIKEPQIKKKFIRSNKNK